MEPSSIRAAALVLALATTACTASHPENDGGLDAGVDAGGYAACTVPSRCVVVPASCCGTCGVATRGDAIAIADAHLGDYRSSVCAGTGCPACAGTPDPTLAATCAAGACAVVDLRLQPMTACTADADCRVRAAACCECGATLDRGTVIALRVDSLASYSALVCDPGTACPDCVPSYAGWSATCTAGRCVAHGPGTP